MRSSVWVCVAAVALVVSACTGSSTTPETSDDGQSTASTTSSLAIPVSTSDSIQDGPSNPLLDGLSLVSSVSAGRMIDDQRPDAIVQHGVDGDGDSPNLLAPVERFFTGDDSDVLLNLVDTAESEMLNPAGSLFVFQIEGLELLETTHEKLTSSDRAFSWNMMQRGLAGNPGGQWKMSLVNESDGTVKAQCVVRDEANRLIRVNSSAELLPGEPSTISCVFDDAKNELLIDVDGRADQPSAVVRKPVDGVEVVVFDPASGIALEQFGDSNPQGGRTCGGLVPDGIGNAVTIGNKPACGVSLDADDQFQGEIAIARVWKSL